MHTQQRNRFELSGAARFWRGVAQITRSRDRIFIVSLCLYRWFSKRPILKARSWHEQSERCFPLRFAFTRSRTHRIDRRNESDSERRDGCTTRANSALPADFVARDALAQASSVARLLSSSSAKKSLFFGPWMHSIDAQCRADTIPRKLVGRGTCVGGAARTTKQAAHVARATLGKNSLPLGILAPRALAAYVIYCN
jgi:hypothetical protein